MTDNPYEAPQTGEKRRARDWPLVMALFFVVVIALCIVGMIYLWVEMYQEQKKQDELMDHKSAEHRQRWITDRENEKAEQRRLVAKYHAELLQDYERRFREIEQRRNNKVGL